MKAYLFNLLFFICSILVSCDDGEGDEFSLVGTNTSISALTGNWNATKALFGNTTGPVVAVDVVAEGGSVTLNIQGTGRFTLTITQQGETPENVTGRMAFDEDLLVIFFDDDPEEWEYFSITHSEPDLMVSGGNGSAGFDFDGDGTDEPADIDFEFVRI